MRTKILASLCVALALISPAQAQTGSYKTPTVLNAEVNTLWPDQISGAITPARARQTFLDIIASYSNVASGNYYLYNGVAILSAQTALNNFYFGAAGNFTATGANNTATGVNALLSNTTGNLLAAYGVFAMQNNTTGANNSAFGYGALYTNTTGDNNTAIGRAALYLNTTGHFNTALGDAALSTNTTGSYNTAIGQDALLVHTTGDFNTVVGTDAAIAQTTAASNTVMGHGALTNNITGSNNTVLGEAALEIATSAANNTVIGQNALLDSTSSSGNTVIGYNTGRGIVTGGNNTILGASVSGLDAALTSNIILADGAGNIRAQYNFGWAFSAAGSAPGLSSCGTLPAIAGSDLAGTVTMGTGSPTGCVITFNKAPLGAAPHCNVTWRATPLASQSYAVSANAITITQTATSSNVIDYHCVGM